MYFIAIALGLFGLLAFGLVVYQQFTIRLVENERLFLSRPLSPLNTPHHNLQPKKMPLKRGIFHYSLELNLLASRLVLFRYNLRHIARNKEVRSYPIHLYMCGLVHQHHDHKRETG